MASQSTDVELQDRTNLKAVNGHRHEVEIPVPSPSEQSTAISSGVQYAGSYQVIAQLERVLTVADEIKTLKRRAQIAIQSYRSEHGLLRRNEDRLEQDIKPRKYPGVTAFDFLSNRFSSRICYWLSEASCLRE